MSSLIVKNIYAVFLCNIKPLWLELNTSRWQQKQIIYFFWWLLRPKPCSLLLTVRCRRYFRHFICRYNLRIHASYLGEPKKAQSPEKASYQSCGSAILHHLLFESAKIQVVARKGFTSLAEVLRLRPTCTPVLKSRRSPEKEKRFLL